VTAKVLRDQPGKVVIESIVGENGRLSLDPADNCIGIAATETLKLLGNPSCGVSLTLHKVRQLKRICSLGECGYNAADAALARQAQQ
jgi:homoserine kinase